MARVFLSYSREDQALARQLVAALENGGCSVWWDGLLSGGERFSRTTAAELAKADAVVVVWSKISIDSHWVHDEATDGRDRGRLVPVSIDGTMPPLGFRQFQVLDLSQWKGKPGTPEIIQLIHSIHAIAAGSSTAPQMQPLPARARGVSRRVVMGSVASLALAGGAFTAWRRHWFFSAASPNSIAVLPFRNLSGDPNQEYFSEGLAEETRLALARNPQLTVTATTSSSMFRNSVESAVAIATKLGVLYILEGSVQHANDLVRIGLKLIDGRTGQTGWFKSLDLAFKDIFGIQDKVSSEVANALTAQVSGEGVRSAQGAVAESGGTTNAAAFDALMRGRAQYNNVNGQAALEAAVKYFDEAINIDANYSAAYANRSKCLADLAGNYASLQEIPGLNRDAIGAARRAVALAPKYSDGHSALGFALLFGQLSLSEARGPFTQSRESGWGNASTLLEFARFSAFDGKGDQAIEASQRALVLDPVNVRAHAAHCRVLYSTRRYTEAVVAARKTLALDPDVPGVHGFLGRSLMLLGDDKHALEASSQETLDYCVACDLSIMHFRLGNKEAAQRAFKDLAALEQTHYQQAEVLAQWGDAEGALSHLEQAFQQRDVGVVELATDPLLDPLRKHAKWAAYEQRIGYRRS